MVNKNIVNRKIGSKKFDFKKISLSIHNLTHKLIYRLFLHPTPCARRTRARSSLIILLAGILSAHELAAVVPYYSVRSQNAFSSRRQVALAARIFPDAIENNYTILSFNTGYMRSFDPDHIAQTIFSNSTRNCHGNSRCDDGRDNTITVSGSAVPNRGSQDWLADYFYLPSDFQSSLSVEPIIDNFYLDFNWYMNLDRWAHGMYIILNVPLVQTRWDLRLCERVINRGVNPSPAGLIAPGGLNRGQLLEDFTSYAQGQLVQPATQIISGINFLTIMQQLKDAKISPHRKKDTGIGDIRTIIGWNLLRDRYHAGINIHISAPGGNRPAGEFLFEPIVGNGHHWEAGAGVNGHYDVWRSEDEFKKVMIYGLATFTHLCATKQNRTFDLVNSPFSRYMLVEDMTSTTSYNLRGGGVAPIAQYNLQVAPLANLSNISVKVSADLQTDIVLGAHLEYFIVSLDLGYNFWHRTCDNIRPLGFNVLDNNSTWAVKGDSLAFGYASAADGVSPTLTAGQPVPLSATESNATIYKGAPLDNPQPATAGGSNTPLLTSFPGTTQSLTSIQPRFIQTSDLDFCSARTGACSSSIFAHAHYRGFEHFGFHPMVGIGGQVEFAHHLHNTCQQTAVSQWQAWLNIGFSFE